MPRRFAVGAALALSVALGASTTVSAQPTVAPAIEAWVQSVEDSPSWTARMRGLSVDEMNGSAWIEHLEIASQPSGITVAVQDVALKGYAAGGQGGFTATSLGIASATIKTKGRDIELTDLQLDDVGVPALLGIAYEGARPFTSLVAAYSAIAKAGVSGGRIRELAITERTNGVTSRMSYGGVEIGRLAGGKIDKVSAGPLKLQSPSPNPLVELSTARAEANAIDLDALLHVYDPSRYLAGVGDGVWRSAVGRSTYTDITMTLPGLKLTFGSATIDDFKVRQPFENFAPLIDAMMADKNASPTTMDRLRSRYLSSILSTYGVGRFSLESMAFASAGIDQLSFDRLYVSDVSSDSIGEAAIEGLVGAVAGQGAIAVGRFALGDVVPPSPELLVTAFGRLRRGANIDASALTPKLGYVDVADMDIRAVDFPGAVLGRMRADFRDYVGAVPTNVEVSLEGLDIATSSLRPARARSLMTTLGYDRIRADGDFSIKWKESDGTVTLDKFRLDIDEFGSTTADAVLSGLPREALERSSEPGDVFAKLLLDRASVTFEDRSLIERSLAMRAELLKVPLDRLKQQLAGALPLMLAFVGNPEKVKEIVPVLQTFIKTPGTLTVEAAPESPVPVPEIAAAARARPQSLPNLLAIEVTGTPGTEADPAPSKGKPGALEDPPEMRNTIEPESRPDGSGATPTDPASPP